MNIRQWLACAFLLLGTGLAAAQNKDSKADKVVYHFTDSAVQGLAGLRNLRNHLDVDSTAQITVVAHGQGVDFLMEGGKDKSGNAYAGPVSALKSRGVRFEVCELTLKSRELSKDQFLQEVDFTPSGVVRVAKLQHEGYAYIKP